MADTTPTPPVRTLAAASGPPLAEEPELGALTLAGYLDEVAGRYAARDALVFHDGATRIAWTYAELRERALAVARALVAAGTAKDMRVGILATNRPEWFAAFFGVALAGGVAVPLSTFSTVSELGYLLAKSGVSILLFEPSVRGRDFAQALRTLAPAVEDGPVGACADPALPYLRRLVAIGSGGAGLAGGWDAFLAGGEAVPRAVVEARGRAVRPGDAGVLFFSSGSTSEPKGVLSSQRAVAIQLWRLPRIFALPEGVRSWAANGFFWSAPVTIVIGGTFSRGGTIVLQSTFQADAAVALIARERVQFPLAMPHQWTQMAASTEWAAADLSAMTYADGATHPSVASDWRTPSALFGGTETFTLATAFPTGTAAADVAGSHGLPLPGNRLKIVDPDSGATQARGERGEIAIKGPTLMTGYVGRVAEETFDPDGYFLTGDGGWLDDAGRLHWEGRLGEIVKTGGANVSPLEIDAVLAECPGVKLCKTVGVPDALLGEMVVACVVAEDGAVLAEGAVRTWLAERLASYKVPRRVLFVDEEALPLTATGKVKAKALREMIVAWDEA